MNLRSFLATLALSVCCAAAPARADFGSYESHRHSEQTLIVRTSLGELRVTAVDDSAFAVHYVEEGVKQLPSFALAGQTAEVTTAVTETAQSIAFAVDGLTAIVNKAPVRIDYAANGQSLVSEEHGYFAYDTVRGFRFELEDGEKILGGGQRVLGMDRRGHRLPLYNKASYGYETEAVQMYYSLPAVMSSDRYMLVFDNSASGWLDIGHTESDVLSFEAVGGRTAYIVIAGDTYPELVGNYTDVTGRQPLPPRWAFGNFASRFGYHSEAETRDVVRRFRKDEIPLDAVILDIYWFGPDIKGHMGNLDWDRDAWPEPEDMIADFAEDGVKTIAVTEPFILTTSNRWEDAVADKVLAKTPTGEPRRFDFYFGNTGLIDIFDESARDWFWQPYAMLFEQGMAGSWGDLGEPEVHPGDALHRLSDAGIEATGDEVHNAFGHVWTKMVYEKQVAAYPEARPLIMMRSGFAGTQRYGIVPWTGDVSRSWGGVKPQVELSLSMGLFGLAYTHSDLGGFAGGEVFDRELYTRWLQYGVFQPVYRPHAQEHIAPEPVFHDEQTKSIVRDFIELRYRLLPYHYTLAYENSTTGMPLMRPLFFEDENDPSLIDEKDAYLWGDAFLVAPVTDPGIESVDVRLPAGAWFDFWSDRRYEGGRHADVPVAPATIPVLVRAGAFVPMVDPVQTTRDYSSEQLTLHYYADRSVRSASGRMYEDDGESRTSLADGAWELLNFEAEQFGDALRIDLGREGGDYPGRPAVRELTLVVHNWASAPASLEFAGEPVGLAPRMPRRGNGATYDADNATLTIRVGWDHEPATFVINDRAAAAVKPVIYQVMTRLFGNKVSTNVPWGTIEENGVGKFADFTDAALAGIRELGTTHIWYTGVPHHALVRDYTAYGIGNDDPDVVKGRAGSPYAVKDYYSVNPDLAVDPARRLGEFEALIERTHDQGMKVLIDIVPNHVARHYESVAKPVGAQDLGANDDTTVEWARDNNFYYIPGTVFRVPEFPARYRPLGGEAHPLADGKFAESPAKWTGNGARVAQPAFSDWYETVKINHGVRPDGSYAFDALPGDAGDWSIAEHAAFWVDRHVPDSWKKFRDIALYWIGKGVDGFRYDMAEMVPVEFWSYLNSAIKATDPDTLLLAEVYDPTLYRDYLEFGRMDYLYDKVGLYDTLKPIIQGRESTDAIAPVHAEVLDIEEHMLHFLENHDEERIASPSFAGDANKARPAMVVSALLGSAPTMIYFGQEVGAVGYGNPAFNDPTPQRTTIYDYAGVPAHQRWMNGGAFDGGALSADEKALRDFYVRLLNLSATEPALAGEYAEIHTFNRALQKGYDEHLFSFVRTQGDERVIVASNFSGTDEYDLTLEVPGEVIGKWGLGPGRYALDERLYGENRSELVVDGGRGSLRLALAPLESVVYRVGDRLFKSWLDPEDYVDDPAGAGVIGTLLYWKDVPSAFLSETRHVGIWLPPGYADEPRRRYPVIYMSDGENLFDPRIAGWGVDWGIDEALSRGVSEGRFGPAIVVGVWSTARRAPEYSPWHGAPDYARFLVEELMPRVNAGFRTLTGPENSFVMGSSMGGLLSFYLVREHPDVFGACGCVSSHLPLSPAIIAPYIGADPSTADATPFIESDIANGETMPGGVRLLLDYGTEGLDAQYAGGHATLREWLLRQGLTEGKDFDIRAYAGADHNEAAWRARVGDQLDWLLGTD